VDEQCAFRTIGADCHGLDRGLRRRAVRARGTQQPTPRNAHCSIHCAGAGYPFDGSAYDKRPALARLHVTIQEHLRRREPCSALDPWSGPFGSGLILPVVRPPGPYRAYDQ